MIIRILKYVLMLLIIGIIGVAFMLIFAVTLKQCGFPDSGQEMLLWQKIFVKAFACVLLGIDFEISFRTVFKESLFGVFFFDNSKGKNRHD